MFEIVVTGQENIQYEVFTQKSALISSDIYAISLGLAQFFYFYIETKKLGKRLRNILMFLFYMKY